MHDTILAGYLAQSASLSGTVPGADAVRELALKDFTEQQFPTQKTEEWRYSDVARLSGTLYTLAQPLKSTPDIPEPLGEYAARFVFLNGYYSENLSDMGDVWQAMPIRPLANHFMSNADRAHELVRGDDGIAFLNTALMRDGLVLSVPSGIEIDEPIEILHIMTGCADAAAHVRHVIELGEEASITLVERYIGDENAYWTNVVTQTRIAESAKLSHIRLQEDGAASLHTSKTYVNLDAAARYEGTTVALGGAVSRFETHARILADEAHATVNGIALAATGQSHDTLTHINHNVPHATSLTQTDSWQ